MFNARFPKRTIVSLLSSFCVLQIFQCSILSSVWPDRKNLWLKPSTAGGLGVFTDAGLAKGHFVCLYAGEFINQEEAPRRFLKQEAAGLGNCILCMRENNAIIGYVDPTFAGNIG